MRQRRRFEAIVAAGRDVSKHKRRIALLLRRPGRLAPVASRPPLRALRLAPRRSRNPFQTQPGAGAVVLVVPSRPAQRLPPGVAIPVAIEAQHRLMKAKSVPHGRQVDPPGKRTDCNDPPAVQRRAGQFQGHPRFVGQFGRPQQDRRPGRVPNVDVAVLDAHPARLMLYGLDRQRLPCRSHPAVLDVQRPAPAQAPRAARKRRCAIRSRSSEATLAQPPPGGRDCLRRLRAAPALRGSAADRSRAAHPTSTLARAIARSRAGGPARREW